MLNGFFMLLNIKCLCSWVATFDLHLVGRTAPTRIVSISGQLSVQCCCDQFSNIKDVFLIVFIYKKKIKLVTV